MADTEPLVPGQDGAPNIFTDPCRWFQAWFCGNPMDAIFVLIVVLCGIGSFLGFFALPFYIATILGALALALSSNRVWALRNLAAEIDRFEAENERLEATQERLEVEVETLKGTKEKLTGHVDRLQGTVGNLQETCDGLHNELEGFEKLKDNIEKFGAETGKDVRKILGEAQKIQAKVENMTNQNQRALLGKIAQDMEFLDQDSGMSRKEFDDFFARIPKQLQNRFKAKGMTFESVAGDDGVIDFMEIENMINELMKETEVKLNTAPA